MLKIQLAGSLDQIEMEGSFIQFTQSVNNAAVQGFTLIHGTSPDGKPLAINMDRILTIQETDVEVDARFP